MAAKTFFFGKQLFFPTENLVFFALRFSVAPVILRPRNILGERQYSCRHPVILHNLGRLLTFFSTLEQAKL